MTVLLWCTTGWRATKVWRKGQDRALWWAFFGLTVMMTLRLPAGRALDQLTGITDLSYLLKHLFGGVLGSAAVLAFLRSVSGQRDGSSRMRRLRILLPLAAAAAMSALFFAKLQPYETNVIFKDFAAHIALLVYTVVFLGFLSTSLLSGMRVCWRWGRDSSSGALGWGLRLIGFGLGAGVAYALVRIAAQLTRFSGNGMLPGALDDRVSSLLLLIALLFIVTGSTLPVLGKLLAGKAERRELLRLYPLWRELTETIPSVRLDPPRGVTAERLDIRNIHGRLYRRTIEIRDAALALSDHAPLNLRERARQHVEARGLFGAQALVSTEACWIAAARRSKLRGDMPTNKEHQPAGGGRDLRSEITALTQLSDAYYSDLTREFADACERPLETQL
ncbi:MAB_1171c family putative transporter [Streptomyces sp. NPDC002055]|uniref:MAB_1171c family putative transporter n=1 Tax=Streptomyces sp. NPDC002055 TaxID=3154534 RepID=UPI003319B381